MTSEIRVGDVIRVRSTDYTNDPHHEHLRACIGRTGVVTEVNTYEGMQETLGFEAIYSVDVTPYQVELIAADVELVARSARITG